MDRGTHPEVGGNKFLGYPSFFYAPFLFPFLTSISLEIITQTRPLIQLRGTRSAASCFSKRGLGRSQQQHEQFWLIWRPWTASGSKGFFLYFNSKVWLFPEIAVCSKLPERGSWRFPGNFPPETCLAETLNKGHWCTADFRGFWWTLVHIFDSTYFQQRISCTLLVAGWRNLAP